MDGAMYQRILVPIDGSVVSRLGLERAIETARLTGARIRLLHVLDELAFASGFEPGVTYERDVLPRMRHAGEQLLPKPARRSPQRASSSTPPRWTEGRCAPQSRRCARGARGVWCLRFRWRRPIRCCAARSTSWYAWSSRRRDCPA